MELKASEFGVVLSVDALKLSRQSPLGIGIGGGGGGGSGACKRADCHSGTDPPVHRLMTTET